jgi:hypothetical protein
MRAWLGAALLLMPLSGCLQGEPASTSSFTASCPNWVEDPHSAGSTSSTVFYNPGPPDKPTPAVRTETDYVPFKGNPETYEGHPADKLAIDFHWRKDPAHPEQPSDPRYVVVEDGLLEMKVFRNDTGQQLTLYDLANPSVRQGTWTFISGTYTNFTLQADLVPSGQAPSPTQLRVEWTFHRDLDGSPNTRTGAEYFFDPYFWYRFC